MLLVYSICIATGLVVWGPILFWLSRWLEPAGRVESPAGKAVSDAGRILAQSTMAVVAVTIALTSRGGASFGDWLLVASVWPLFIPMLGLYVWSKFFSFLALPLLGAIISAAITTLLWRRFLTGRWRAIWPIVAVLTFSITIIGLCQLQFDRDLASSAARLAPDCLDQKSFLEAVRLAGRQNFGLHASAAKGDDAYGWSFRSRDFYKLPPNVKKNVFPHRGSRTVAPYRSCATADIRLHLP
jgi:hypothetical protein